jgi:5-methylcytosine-specific restriction endonuclease McrA
MRPVLNAANRAPAASRKIHQPLGAQISGAGGTYHLGVVSHLPDYPSLEPLIRSALVLLRRERLSRCSRRWLHCWASPKAYRMVCVDISFVRLSEVQHKSIWPVTRTGHISCQQFRRGIGHDAERQPRYVIEPNGGTPDSVLQRHRPEGGQGLALAHDLYTGDYMSIRESRVTMRSLLANPPKLHRVQGEWSSRWKLQDDDLRYLDTKIEPGMRTLETGAGLSTVVFAMKGAEHTCIVPSDETVNRIREFCTESRISLAGVQFVIDRSEHALPRLTQSNYEFVLIDGRHGFPAPFIDCYYAARLLKVGGCVMVDDLHIWTIELLVEYLRSDTSWKLARETWHSATFVKCSDEALDTEWTRQPFVVKRSLRSSFGAKLRFVQRIIRTRDLPSIRPIIRKHQ